MTFSFTSRASATSFTNAVLPAPISPYKFIKHPSLMSDANLYANFFVSLSYDKFVGISSYISALFLPLFFALYKALSAFCKNIFSSSPDLYSETPRLIVTLIFFFVRICIDFRNVNLSFFNSFSKSLGYHFSFIKFCIRKNYREFFSAISSCNIIIS